MNENRKAAIRLYKFKIAAIEDMTDEEFDEAGEATPESIRRDYVFNVIDFEQVDFVDLKWLAKDLKKGSLHMSHDEVTKHIDILCKEKKIIMRKVLVDSTHDRRNPRNVLNACVGVV